MTYIQTCASRLSTSSLYSFAYHFNALKGSYSDVLLQYQFMGIMTLKWCLISNLATIRSIHSLTIKFKRISRKSGEGFEMHCSLSRSERWSLLNVGYVWQLCRHGATAELMSCCISSFLSQSRSHGTTSWRKRTQFDKTWMTFTGFSQLRWRLSYSERWMRAGYTISSRSVGGWEGYIYAMLCSLVWRRQERARKYLYHKYF